MNALKYILTKMIFAKKKNKKKKKLKHVFAEQPLAKPVQSVWLKVDQVLWMEILN